MVIKARPTCFLSWKVTLRMRGGKVVLVFDHTQKWLPHDVVLNKMQPSPS